MDKDVMVMTVNSGRAALFFTYLEWDNCIRGKLLYVINLSEISIPFKLTHMVIKPPNLNE